MLDGLRRDFDGHAFIDCLMISDISRLWPRRRRDARAAARLPFYMMRH